MTISVGLAIVPIAVILLIFLVQKARLQSKMVDSELRSVIAGVQTVCVSQNMALEKYLLSTIHVAEDMIRRQGNISIIGGRAEWTAINQLTKENEKISLPHIGIGGSWLGQNYSFDQRTPVVDDVQKLSGVTCTIFQRMNEKGDMLRVGTSVKGADGKRAIGTYIPALNANGTPNKIIESVLSGKEFVGRAFVVGKWNFTAYAPITSGGTVIGMLYIGVPEEAFPAARQSVLSKDLGAGHMFVLAGSGASRGEYIISKGGKKDGKNVWEAKDKKGNPYIQTIIEAAVKAKGEIVSVPPYRVQEDDGTYSKTMVAYVAYFEPWDWVIGAAIPQGDLFALNPLVASALRSMMIICVLTGLVLVLIALYVSREMGLDIAVPIDRVTRHLKEVAKGDFSIPVSPNALARPDELGDMARAIDLLNKSVGEMIGKVKVSSRNLVASSDQIAKASQQVADGAQ